MNGFLSYHRRLNVRKLSMTMPVMIIILMNINVGVVFMVQADKIHMDLGDLGDLFGALGSAAKQKKDGSCPSPCTSQTFFPVPKRRIRPYSNGCSVPESMRSGLGDYSHFEPCCDLHDACYASCGISKPFCEQEFQKCMKRTCTKKFAKNEAKLQPCNEMADLFYSGTYIFGCKGYTELQSEACQCIASEEKAMDAVTEYVKDFYAAYNQTHEIPERLLKKFIPDAADAASQQRRNKKPQGIPQPGDDISNGITEAERIQKSAKYGELLYRLYRKYPQSIDQISRDGKSSRKHEVRFPKPKKSTKTTTANKKRKEEL